MKKIFFFILIFVSFQAFSQVRQPQTLGSPSTDVYSRGTIGSDSGLVFRRNFPDTLHSTIGSIRNIPNLLLVVNGKLLKRDPTATFWEQMIGSLDTSTMLSTYLNDVGYGLLRTGKVARFDSATVFPQIRSTIFQRFGVTGEDKSFTANRSVNGHNIYGFQFDSLAYFNLRNGSNYYETVLTGSSPYSEINMSSPGGFGYYQSGAADASNGIWNVASSGGLGNQYMAVQSTSGYQKAQVGNYTNGSGEWIDMKEEFYNDHTDAGTYYVNHREKWTGDLGFTSAIFRLDSLGASMRTKTTIGADGLGYKGILVDSNSNVRFENYPSSRNDGLTTKMLYIGDAAGNIKYGYIDSFTFATRAALYKVRDSLGALIGGGAVNIYNTDGTLDDAVRTLTLDGKQLKIAGSGSNTFITNPADVQWSVINSGGRDYTFTFGGGQINLATSPTTTGVSGILDLNTSYTELNSQNTSGPESHIRIYPDSIAFTAQDGIYSFNDVDIDDAVTYLYGEDAAGHLVKRAVSSISGASDGNGIYTGNGSLSGATVVTQSTNTLTFNGSTTGNQILSANSSTGTALKGTTTGGGTGVWGETSGNGWGGYFKSATGNGIETDGGTGTAVYAHTTTGIVFSGINTGDRTANLPVFAIEGNWASTNSNETIAQFNRTSSGTVDDGISGSIDMMVENLSVTSLAIRATARWDETTFASRLSALDIDGFNAGTQEVYMRMQPDWVIVNNLTDTLATMGYARSVGGGGGGYTNLTQFVAQTAHRLFYSDGNGDVQELAFGSSGEYLKSNGTTSAPSWDTPAGSGTINSGTTGKPAYYTGATTLDDFAAVDYATSGTNVKVTSLNTTDVPFEIKGISSQSANLLNISSSAGTGDLAIISAAGASRFTSLKIGTASTRKIELFANGEALFTSDATATLQDPDAFDNTHQIYGDNNTRFLVSSGSGYDHRLVNVTGSLSAVYTGFVDGGGVIMETNQALNFGTNKTVKAIIAASGALKLTQYGSGTFTGTATKFLAVDASGNIIEENAPGGASTFAGLTDVNLTSITTEDFLKWNGTDWINRSPSQVRTDLSLVIGTNVQAWDADLDALAGMANGIAVRTGAGTYSPRTITGTTNQIDVTNGTGVGGDPTLSLPASLALTGSATGPNEVRLAEDTDNGTSYGALTVPASMAGTRLYTFPDANTTIPIFSQTITFTGPSTARTVTLPDLNFTVARSDAAQTFTGTQTFSQVITTNNAITASGNAATVPVTSAISTVTNNSAATLTITLTTASAVDGQVVTVRVLDFSGVAQTIAWVNTENSSIVAPTTSNGSTTLFLTVKFIYNSATSKWRCIGYA